MTEREVQLLEWGKALSEIAVHAISYSSVAKCGEQAAPKRQCNQGQWHYTYCGKLASWIEQDIADNGSTSWVLRCDEHSVAEKWNPRVSIEPPTYAVKK